MEGKELDFATKEDLLKLQQDLKMEIQKVTIPLYYKYREFKYGY